MAKTDAIVTRKQKREPLLVRLLARLGEVDFEEAYIPRDKGRDIYGMWHPEGRITINPVPHVVQTILHELLHEHAQTYKERAVDSVVGKLYNQLTEGEIAAIYEEFVKRMRRSKALQDAEDGRFE